MREKALEWWGYLTFNEAQKFYLLWINDPNNKSTLSFAMVCGSSSVIEFIYRKYYLDEDVHF